MPPPQKNTHTYLIIGKSFVYSGIENSEGVLDLVALRLREVRCMPGLDVTRRQVHLRLGVGVWGLWLVVWRLGSVGCVSLPKRT